MKSKSIYTNILELNLAILFISTSGVLGKYIDLPVPIIVLLRALIAGFLLLVYCKVKKISFKIKTEDRLSILVGGLFLGAHWISYFYAIKFSNVAIGMLTLYTFPAIITLLEPLLTKSKFQVIHLALGGLVLFGVYLLSPNFNFESKDFIGVCLGILSAVFYSIRIIMLKSKVQHYNQSALMLHQLVIITIFLLPTYWMMDHSNIINFLPSTILLAVVTTAIGHTLFVYSLQHFTAASASLISSLQPIFGIILAMVFLGEYPNLQTVLGGLVIISTVLIESMRFIKLKKNS